MIYSTAILQTIYGLSMIKSPQTFCHQVIKPRHMTITGQQTVNMGHNTE